MTRVRKNGIIYLYTTIDGEERTAVDGAVLETERLVMRKMTWDDKDALSLILCDDDVMYAYNGAFDDEGVNDWIERQLARYDEYNFGLWAVILKETGELIGQCGLTIQRWDEKEVLEIGYLFRKEYWHNGYATEAAAACKEYAFSELGADKVYSIIRDTNIPSQRGAERNGMRKVGETVKHYRGVNMPHYIYCTELGSKHDTNHGGHVKWNI